MTDPTKPYEHVAEALPPAERLALHAWADRNRVRRDDPAWAIAELFLVLSEASAERLRAGAEAAAAVPGEVARALEDVDVRLAEAASGAERAAARVEGHLARAERAANALQAPLQAALRRLEPERGRRRRYLAAHAALLLALTAGAFLAGDRYRASWAYDRLPIAVSAEPAAAVAGEVLTRHLYWALDEGGRTELRAFVGRASSDSVRLTERGDRLLIEHRGRRVVVGRGAKP